MENYLTPVVLGTNPLGSHSVVVRTFAFRLCAAAYLIKAFDVVIPTMKCGEICEVIVFPDYAYNDSQIRRYEIELLSFYGKFCMGNLSYMIS